MNRNKTAVKASSTSKSSVIGEFTGKCGDYSVHNNNDMKLGRKLFEILFASEDYKRAMKNRYYIGFLGHPEDPNCMDFKDACIVMTECHIEDNGDVMGTFDLIDTPVGRVVKAFIDAGVTFGISIRGAGDVDANGEVNPETFIFRGFDLVTFPAYNDAVPTFREIAASTDIDKKRKYNIVCSTLTRNLQDITSSEALNLIQSQLTPGSEEYNAVEARKAELAETAVEGSDESLDGEDLTQEKLEGMTQLYLQATETIADLQKQLIEANDKAARVESTCNRKLRTVRRIAASQIADLTHELQSVTASNKVLVAANSKLKNEVQVAAEDNLKYSHKIEANSQTIAQKDSTISKLRAELGETVTASTRLENRASNLGEKCESLSVRVEAAEQRVFEYQQAYANMLANALGIHLENLPISASTSPDELRQMITGGTSTSNIAAKPSTQVESLELVEPSDSDNVDDIVTL